MNTQVQNIEVKTRCSGAIMDASAVVMLVGRVRSKRKAPRDTAPGPSLTVVSQQLSEGLTPPSVSSCTLAGYGALSHLADFSSELYLRDKQEEIDREDASTEL